MKTLKKTLCLVLVVCMVLSLGTIGAGAAFTDTADADYTQAIDVMTGIGVINGMTTTTFEPDSGLTREQAAKIITYMLLGPTNAALVSTATTQRFTDVATSRWSAGYIEYCANIGIINGVGDNKFDPTGVLTTCAFSKMLLCALGYDASIEKYTGASWAINVAADAVDAGIAQDGIVLSASTPITREQACQLALLTLKATMVSYATRGTSITIDGIVINTGASAAEEVYSASTANQNIYTGTAVDGKYTLQFGEKYFTKLVLTTGTADIYGRPATKWVNNSKTVGTYSETPVATFTAGTKAPAVATALSGYYLPDNTATPVYYKVENVTALDIVSDDIFVRNNATGAAITFTADTVAAVIAAETANGKIVEVYADKDKHITKIVEVSYTVGTVSSVTTTATKTTFVVGGNTAIDYVDADISDTIIAYTGIAKDAVVTFVKLAGNNMLVVLPTTTVSGSQSTKSSAGTITVAGTVYTVGSGVSDGVDAVALDDFTNSNNAANYYLDQFGYVVKTTASAASTDYAYIVATYGTLSTTIDGSTPSVTVKTVMDDGTVANYPVKLTKLTASTAGGTSVNNPALEDADGAGANPVGATVTLAAGDYVIAGTSILVYDAAVVTGGTWTGNTAATVNTAAGLLADVYGYTMSDGTISLQALTAAPTDGTDMAAGAVRHMDDVDALAYGVTNMTVSNVTALISNTTLYVVYNTEKGTASVYTGNTGLPTTATAGTINNADVVIKVPALGDVGNASIVFVTVASGFTPATTTNLAYVDYTKFDTVLTATGTTFTYTATKADSSTITLTATTALTESGVYTYNADNTVAIANLKLGTGDTTFTGGTDVYAYDATLTVSGALLAAASGYYNITDATQIVYINPDLGAVHENGGFVILATNSAGNATADVATIYITID